MTKAFTDRTIFHCDCNSFFASVEETFHPEYKNIPMAVAGDPEARHGIILAKNEIAKSFGIKTAETIHSARKKCPELFLCPPRRHTYSDFCSRINAIYEQYTDLVERFGIDESYLDITGSLHLFGSDPLKLAHEIRQRVAREIGITISVGVSWNKIFAKLGSDYKKPNAVTVISLENYRQLVWPLSVSDMLLVGKNTAAELQKFGIRTIGDLAAADTAFLVQQFGKMGVPLHRYANGLDDSPVSRVGEVDPIKSVGNGMTYRRDITDEKDIRTGIQSLSHSVAARLRRADLKCATVQVTIKDTRLQVITRQKTLPSPTYLAAEISCAVLALISEAWPSGKPIRLLTVTAQKLIPANQPVTQVSFFDGETESLSSKKAEKLEKTMDEIHRKYGSHSIQSGSILGNDIGISDI